MATKTVTLELPEPLYERYKQLAAQTGRSVEDELLEVILEAAPQEGLPPDLAKETAAMNLFNDKDLWKVARSRMPLRSLNQLVLTSGMVDNSRQPPPRLTSPKA